MKDKDCEVVSSNTSEINLTYPETEDEMAVIITLFYN